VHTLPASSPRRPLRAALAVARTIERSGARIVHSHFGGYDIPTRLAISAGAHRDRVLIWHYRTALPEGVAGRGAARRIKDFAKYRVLAGRVDRCVAVTTATATEAALRGLGPRAVAISSGCDTDTFRPDPALRADARRRLGLADDDVVLLHFGWYPHRKGNDVLAEAVRLLNERGLGPLVALSVGAPSAAPPLRTLPFTDDVLELHQAADIFVSASRSEAFGNGVVEALACGNVAVATLASGQREIFEGLEGCWTARPGDAESLGRLATPRRSQPPACRR
jgi:glycosyltransferase involved in cell wall biosynthesis